MLSGASWRIRLVFVGANPDNVSGESRKYWQVTRISGEYACEIRWGRLGSRGQSQRVRFANEAIDRALEKVRKGYVVDRDTEERARAVELRNQERERARVLATLPGGVLRPATPASLSAPPASLTERVALVSWRALPSDDALIDAAASLGWVPLDLDDVPAGHRLFVGKGGAIWGVRLSPLAYGALPVGGA